MKIKNPNISIWWPRDITGSKRPAGDQGIKAEVAWENGDIDTLTRTDGTWLTEGGTIPLNWLIDRLEAARTDHRRIDGLAF